MLLLKIRNGTMTFFSLNVHVQYKENCLTSNLSQIYSLCHTFYNFGNSYIITWMLCQIFIYVQLAKITSSPPLLLDESTYQQMRSTLANFPLSIYYFSYFEETLLFSLELDMPVRK